MADFQLDAELAYAAWIAGEEETIQKNIITARSYFEGDHDAKLTERMKEFLYHQRKGEQRFAVNYCAMIVKAVYERLIVKAFTSENDTLAGWAWDLWQANRMDAKQINVHKMTVCDGEAFVFVDWDDVNKRPVFIPHPRYTDPSFDGTGFGCKAHYPDDDPNQPMRYASKRWVETIENENGTTKHRRRMTIYYPDHVEKWVAAEGARGREYRESGWMPYEEDGEPWPIPWVDGNGQPLGIPLIHFYNPARRTELWDAVPLQDLINKTSLDIIAIADSCGFPIRWVDGATPTTDGKPAEADGSNLLKLFPGAFVELPKDSTVTTEQPADIVRLHESLNDWIIKLAQVTDTPTSRFQITRQIAAEGTLKQQEAPLLAKVRIRQTLFGNAWEDAMYMARRLAGVYGEAQEDALLSTEWENAETRDDKAFREALQLEMLMGVPKEMLWAKLGYEQDEIAKMKAMAGEEMQQTSNLGGELLRAFEGGGQVGGEQ
jgi:hypothetical protein